MNHQSDYFIVNRETGKLELHFSKEAYLALTEDQKKSIKGNFLWGRTSDCWISRAKEPNLYHARKCAETLGLEDAGTCGERLSFMEQMERKAERAERRADCYENRADAAERRGEALQKPINDMRGDIAFFTQPNINSSSGRVFTRRRKKMFESFEKGFNEFLKSEYWQDRARIARRTAEKREFQDKAFICRRIAERESDIRKLKKSVEQWTVYIEAFENGETPLDGWGSPLRCTAEQAIHQLESYLDRLEAKLDELGFYQDCLARLGGVAFSRENVKLGSTVAVSRWGTGIVKSVGPKNCVVVFRCGIVKVAYAEIEEIIQ